MMNFEELERHVETNYNHNWVHMLYRHPEYIRLCPFHRLAGYELASLFVDHPSAIHIIDQSDLDRLDMDDWINIISDNPEIMTYCPELPEDHMKYIMGFMDTVGIYPIDY